MNMAENRDLEAATSPIISLSEGLILYFHTYQGTEISRLFVNVSLRSKIFNVKFWFLEKSLF